MRLRWFLSMTAVLVLAAAATVLVYDRLGAGSGAADQRVGSVDGPDDGASTTSTSLGRDEPGLPPGQLTVRGAVTAVHLEGAVLEPRAVATPLTIVADRGLGNGGEVTGVLVEGRPASVVWDGGRPFVLASGGALVLDPVVVDLVPEGLRLALADARHGFTPGTYRLDTPVAVGSAGVAAARDSVTFEAVDSSTFGGAGDAALVLGPDRARRLLGPGRMRLEGSFEVTDADGTRAVSTVDGADVAFDLTLTPLEGGGWTVRGTVQGVTTET